MASDAAKDWIRVPNTPLTHNPATTYLDHLSPGSQRAIRQALEAMANQVVQPKPPSEPLTAEQFRWEALRHQHAKALREHLSDRYSPATVNKFLSALRGVLRTCRDLGLMNESDFQSAISVANVPLAWQPPETHFLSATQVKALFHACDRHDNPAAKRDAALLTIFLATGLRRSEAAALNLSDFDATAGTLRIHSPEPRKCRVVHLRESAAQRLLKWTSAVFDEADFDCPLLLAVNKGGRVQPRRCTDQAIYNMIHRIGKESGLPMVTSRALRLTYVVTLIARGLAAAQVQALAGHASWLTTAAYARLAQKVHEHRTTLPGLLLDLNKTLRSLRSQEQIRSHLNLPGEKGHNDGKSSHDDCQ